jgi:hypothetical protein
MIGVYERTMTLPGDVVHNSKCTGQATEGLAMAAPDNHQRVARMLADLVMPPKAAHAPALKAKS